MGNFSRDTFDKLKHYVGVRLQQSVPLLDADWNELEDIRRHELQTFLKWFVGNGVPKGNDGFHILSAQESKNDFIIKGGDGIHAGHCVVEGWDVVNESNLRYTEQPLYRNEELATQWGVDPLPPLTIPVGDRTDTVYLDVWEREVNAEEDEDLINQDIGIETCVRIKREWAVRVAENATSPPSPAPAGHLFYPLASLSRKSGEGDILDEHITDLRITGLSIMSYYDVDQIVHDAFGAEYTQDHDGQPNLTVSLREAINALLRGRLPVTPETQLTDDEDSIDFPSALEDSRKYIWIFWNSLREDNWNIYYRRYNPVTGWEESDSRLITELEPHSPPFVLEYKRKDIWVFWDAEKEDNHNIYYRRYTPGKGWEESDNKLITDTDYDYFPYALEDSGGDIWVFWLSPRSGYSHIYYKRYNPVDGWESEDNQHTTVGYNYNPFVLKDSRGDIWVFWDAQRIESQDIYYSRYNNTSGWVEDNAQLTNDWYADSNPFVLYDKRENIWVFWISYRYGEQGYNRNIYCKRYTPDASENGDYGWWSGEIQLTEGEAYIENINAFEDSNGDLWVFWQSYSFISGEVKVNISCKRSIGGSASWGPPLKLITTEYSDIWRSYFAFEDSFKNIWLFWLNTEIIEEEYTKSIWYKKLITTI
ncbi:MAG: DUF6519 domain-containing protein [bacterium]